MLYSEDLKIQIVKKLRAKGFVFGARDKDNKLRFPYVELTVENDTDGGTKSNVYHNVTMNVEIIANGDDETSSRINDLQESVMKALHTEYVGEEHDIALQRLGTIVYIEEDDEKYNIYRRIIPYDFIIQTNNF